MAIGEPTAGQLTRPGVVHTRPSMSPGFVARQLDAEFFLPVALLIYLRTRWQIRRRSLIRPSVKAGPFGLAGSRLLAGPRLAPAEADAEVGFGLRVHVRHVFWMALPSDPQLMILDLVLSWKQRRIRQRRRNKMQLVLPLGEVPLDGTVTKKAGSTLYLVRDEFSFYSEDGKKLYSFTAKKGTRLLIPEGPRPVSAECVTSETEVCWHAREAVILEFLSTRELGTPQ